MSLGMNNFESLVYLSDQTTMRGMVPSKFLNVYDFGMKMYTTEPITAQLSFQEELSFSFQFTYFGGGGTSKPIKLCRSV